MNKQNITAYIGVLLISLGSITSTFAVDTKTESVDVEKLQAAIQAFGVDTEQAKQAASISASMIEDKQVKDKEKSQEITLIPDDFLETSPY